ncbi:DNRLRE domain-containing protein [candidate division WOR-3 bacterium]|uniref:DNRLRE domain-containing protein n=1 Tax=candidate division WOR-3 bacterium TaxID=2052148 RepID=A0A9D5QCJ2_UNCW3|nr:DNRLRE domain-containing protein [candidate division WOR-3 bacterium]MBD3364107.1 DNRLRE domain-containing protein [candidate division WOR-3 bacterium]
MKSITVITCLTLCLASIGTAEVVVDTLEAHQDTYIDEFTPTKVRGGETRLTLWNEPDPYFYILIQFDLSPYKAYMSARPDTLVDFMSGVLDLYCYFSGGAGTGAAYKADDDWDENTANYNNMPAWDDGQSVMVDLPDMNGAWLDLDLTDLIKPEPGDTWPDFSSFYLFAVDPGSWDFFSKDCDTCAYLADNELTPKLYLTWEVTTGTEEKPLEVADFNVPQQSVDGLAIDYYIPTGQSAFISIFDASGSLVETLDAETGNHSVVRALSPGVYFIRMNTGDFVISRKAIVIR